MAGPVSQMPLGGKTAGGCISLRAAGRTCLLHQEVRDVARYAKPRTMPQPSALGCPTKAAHNLTCSTNRMFLRFRQKTPLSNDRP